VRLTNYHCEHDFEVDVGCGLAWYATAASFGEKMLRSVSVCATLRAESG
jgi:hypothetical protein